MGVPTKLPKPTREYPASRTKTSWRRADSVFGEDPRRDLLTGFDFTINAALYQEMECSTRPRAARELSKFGHVRDSTEEKQRQRQPDDTRPIRAVEDTGMMQNILMTS